MLPCFGGKEIRALLYLMSFPTKRKLLYSFSMSYGSLVGMTSTSMPIGIFNKKHPFVHWLLRFREACLKGDFNLDDRAV